MKTLSGFTVRILFLYVALCLGTACQKETKILYDFIRKDHTVKKVFVYTVNELYTAVNDPLNAGSRIVLAPGTYVLDASKPDGGRLELQLNMQLHGQAGHPEKVVIDASTLPASSFVLPLTSFPSGLRTGSIRTGKGSNTIEWVTLMGNISSTGVIDTDLTGTPATYLKVAHTIIKHGGTGINVRNRDEQNNGHLILAEITDNDITEIGPGSFGIGIWIWNARNVHDAIIRAELSRNYVHGNRVGVSAINIVADKCRIEVTSDADRIESNGIGLSLFAGANEYPNFTTNHNVLTFEAHGTSIRNNNGTPAPSVPRFVPGGISLIGGIVNPTSLPGTVNNNTLYASFWGCRIEGNLESYQIHAFGARSIFASSSDPAGTNNVVNLNLFGISKEASVNVVPSFPAEPAGTNKVNVNR